MLSTYASVSSYAMSSLNDKSCTFLFAPNFRRFILILSSHEQAILMRDRETGRSRGFGFVTYGSDDEAQAAIAGMNETELDGRSIRVNMVNPRGGGGGGGGGGGYSSGV